VVVLGAWLVPWDNPKIVLTAGVLVFALGGALAGWRRAWLVVPAGFWLATWARSGTDCPDCGGGGEPMDRAALVLGLAILTVAIAAIGLTAGALARFFEPRRLRDHTPAMIAASVGLLALTGVLAVGRYLDERDRNGDVVFEQFGIRYREGPEWKGGVGAVRDKATAFEGAPVVWLGSEYAGYNLKAVQEGYGETTSLLLVYGDCGPAPCPVGLSLMMRKECSIPPEFAQAGAADEVLPGGAHLLRFLSDPNKLAIWTGNVSIDIYVTGAPAHKERLPQDIRTLDGSELPPPAPATC